MTITLDTVSLPDDAHWSDRYRYTSITQSKKRSLSGKLHVHEDVKQKGRPITLESHRNGAWIQKSTLDALTTLIEAQGNIMTLTYYSQTFDVMVDRERGTGLEADLVHPIADPDDTKYYRFKLFLITV